MKVLRLTTLLDFGGQEVQYLSFTEKPHLLKHQYIFCSIGFGGFAEKELIKRGFQVIILNKKYSVRQITNLWHIYRLIRKLKPDLVHSAASEANIYGIIAAKLAGVPTIIGEEIGISDHSKLARFIFSKVYRLADKVVCVSKSVKKHLIGLGEISDNKGVVVYNPVSMPKIYQKQHNRQFIMIYVGRLEEVKNVATLIQAFKCISDRNAMLHIVGDGRERKHLEQLVQNLELTEKVVFFGFQKEPAKYVSQADLFVLPSFSEGFGIAAVEAMLQNVPSLCSRVGGIPEFIEDGRNGWLFDPKNKEELIHKLEVILNLDETDRNKIASAGYETAIARFTIEQYINEIENVYERKD